MFLSSFLSDKSGDTYVSQSRKVINMSYRHIIIIIIIIYTLVYNCILCFGDVSFVLLNIIQLNFISGPLPRGVPVHILMSPVREVQTPPPSPFYHSFSDNIQSPVSSGWCFMQSNARYLPLCFHVAFLLFAVYSTLSINIRLLLVLLGWLGHKSDIL